MELSNYILKQQREMAQAIKDKLDTIVPLDAKKEEDLVAAKVYCDGCILACKLAGEALQHEAAAKKEPKEAVEPGAAQEPAQEAPAKKKRSHHKKKEDTAPAEEPKEEPKETPAAAPAEPDDDLDDLF